jgi:hypothetical protein
MERKWNALDGGVSTLIATYYRTGGKSPKGARASHLCPFNQRRTRFPYPIWSLVTSHHTRC